MIAPNDTFASRANTQTPLAAIEALAARLSDSGNALDDTLAEYQRELQAVNDRFLKPLKRLAAETATAEAELHTAIERNPDLFVKPRTLTMHGIKLGFTHSKGKLVWDDEETVIKLLKKRFPEMQDTLIRSTEEVNKDGVKALDLDKETLKKLGLEIEGEGDVVYISRAAGELEKLFTKLKTKLVEAMVAD